MNLTQASHQWAKRPPDERFTSLTAMAEKLSARRAGSHAIALANKKLFATPIEGDRQGLAILNRERDEALLPTNWAFGQICGRVEAPAGYLRTLDPRLAADNLNYGLARREVEDIGLLSRRGDGQDTRSLAAVTGPNYGRVWDSEIVDAIIRRFGDGVTGDFRVPGEWGKAVDVTKANTTLYASDRDMFVFLADETNRIEVHNRRNGQPGLLARGFFAWNSEVGSESFGFASFLFDYVCGNRIVWGAEQFSEIRIRHTKSAPDRFIGEIAPALITYAKSSTASISEAVEAAQARRIENDVEDFFKTQRFSSGQVRGIMLAHEADEGRPIETLWDAATGITAYARSIEYQADRVELERKAGKLLKAAA